MSSILDKLNKLRAMRDQTSSPAEAAIAIKKMQALLEEHNLTERDLDRYQVGEVSIKSTQAVSNVKDWENDIMWTVAKAFGGSVMWRSGHSWLYDKHMARTRNPDPFGSFVLVGFKSTLPLMEYTATLLLRTVVEGRRKLNTTLPKAMPRAVKTYELDGFCQGFVAAVRDKVVGMQADPLIDEYVNDITAGRDPKETQNRNGGLAGQAAGVLAGLEFDIHRPMDQQAAALQLEHKLG